MRSGSVRSPSWVHFFTFSTARTSRSLRLSRRCRLARRKGVRGIFHRAGRTEVITHATAAQEHRTAEGRHQTKPAQQEPFKAFSSEVGTTSRREPKVRVSEYATKQNVRAIFRFNRIGKCSKRRAFHRLSLFAAIPAAADWHQFS